MYVFVFKRFHEQETNKRARRKERREKRHLKLLYHDDYQLLMFVFFQNAQKYPQNANFVDMFVHLHHSLRYISTH